MPGGRGLGFGVSLSPSGDKIGREEPGWGCTEGNPAFWGVAGGLGVAGRGLGASLSLSLSLSLSFGLSRCAFLRPDVRLAGAAPGARDPAIVGHRAVGGGRWAWPPPWT